MTVIVYPREVICSRCGVAMYLEYNGSRYYFEDPVYKHPKNMGCEYNGEILKPVGMNAEVLK